MDQERVPAEIRVSTKPHLHRDVFWCWIVNEPFVLKYDEANNPCCALCGWTSPKTWTREEGSGLGPIPLPEDFLGGSGQHPFICHVWKPQWSYMEEAAYMDWRSYHLPDRFPSGEQPPVPHDPV